MARPLYRGSEAARRHEHGHAGLWYDKFCDRWPTGAGASDGLGTEKMKWIEQVVSGKVGDPALLDDYYARRTQLVTRNGGRLLCVKTTSRLVTGLGRAHPVENGFAWHPTLGTPYLPGSSIKGLMRAWARTARDEEELAARLGTRHTRGDVMILDALPLKPVELEADVMTPHYDDYYRGQEPPGDWMSPTPIPFLVVARDTIFHFGLIPRGAQARACLDEVSAWLVRALGELGAGAKTSVGYGLFGEPETAPLVVERWLDARARERQRLEAMSEAQALELVLRLMRNQELDGDPALVREELAKLYHEDWSQGQRKDPATPHSVAKLKEYAAYLRPPTHERSPEAPALAEDEAACIESCRGDKAKIKEVGEQLMQGHGPLRTSDGRRAFLQVAKDKLAKGKNVDQQWLKRLIAFMRKLD
jgi:CRISPR-associated protein Cmr6